MSAPAATASPAAEIDREREAPKVDRLQTRETMLLAESGAPYLIALSKSLRACVTKSGGIDLRDPDLLHQAADALCDLAAPAIETGPSVEEVRDILRATVSVDRSWVIPRLSEPSIDEAARQIAQLYQKGGER